MTIEQEARKMHDDEVHLWPTLRTPAGVELPHQPWRGCNDEHRQRYRNLVTRLRSEKGA